MSVETRQAWEPLGLKEEVLCGCGHPCADHARFVFQKHFGLSTTGSCSMPGCSCGGASSEDPETGISTITWTYPVLLAG